MAESKASLRHRRVLFPETFVASKILSTAQTLKR
jgi:hypothetical protein